MTSASGRQTTSSVRVRYAETDKMGVVYHSNYLIWFEIGRTTLLKEIGLPYRELETAGFRLPVLEVTAKYLRPAVYDDVLTIITTMREKPLLRITLEYEVRRGEELLGRPVEVGQELVQVASTEGNWIELVEVPDDDMGPVLAAQAKLEREIANVAAQGFAIIDEELEIGLRSIAVPVRDRAGRVVAAINISTQSSRFSPDEMKALILPALKDAAGSIENYFAVQ